MSCTTIFISNDVTRVRFSLDNCAAMCRTPVPRIIIMIWSLFPHITSYFV